jgi:hypothetical protein
VLFTVVASVGAFPVGWYIGTAVGYGTLAWVARQQKVEFALQVGHLDDAAGWRAVGDLFFAQAMLLAIPAAHLAVWWLLIPAFDGYESWRDPYAAMLFIVVGCEILAFVLPLLVFHEEMRRLKRERLPEADDLARRVVALREAIAREPDATARKGLKEEMEVLTERYQAIQSLPTWPVAAPTRRRFALNNAILGLPMATSLLEGNGVRWSDVTDAVKSWLGG